MNDKHGKPKTYPHTLPDGRTVRVTIPPAPTAEEPAKPKLGVPKMGSGEETETTE